MTTVGVQATMVPNINQLRMDSRNRGVTTVVGIIPVTKVGVERDITTKVGMTDINQVKII